MDSETFYAFCFMAFCFSFYLLVFWLITSDSRRQDDRAERRELMLLNLQYKNRKKFGNEAVEQSLDAAQKRKSLLRRVI